MLTIRHFSQEQLELCNKWFSLVETTDIWNELGPVGDGESQSIRVQNTDGLIGVAKPGQPKTDGICRAAHEKIAFDLAHILEFPVPPVILWDRGDGHQDNRYLSISAWAFPQSVKWNNAQQMGILTEQLQLSVGPALSAMHVFHTWISNTDRKSDHIQVNIDSQGDELEIAFIDHAYSMSQVWKGDNWQVGECPKYLYELVIPEIISQVIENIENYPKNKIEEIVTRIPIHYLSETES
jgi:hypothetical protein